MSLPIAIEEGPCIANLPVCGASCCKSMTFNMAGNKRDVIKGAVLQFRALLTDDLRHYYKLHGLTVTRDTLFIPLEDYKLEGDVLTVYRRCNWLTEDLRCKAHGTPQKPRVCQALTWETVGQRRMTLTEGCVFKNSKPAED